MSALFAHICWMLHMAWHNKYLMGEVKIFGRSKSYLPMRLLFWSKGIFQIPSFILLLFPSYGFCGFWLIAIINCRQSPIFISQSSPPKKCDVRYRNDLIYLSPQRGEACSTITPAPRGGEAPEIQRGWAIFPRAASKWSSGASAPAEPGLLVALHTVCCYDLLPTLFSHSVCNLLLLHIFSLLSGEEKIKVQSVEVAGSRPIYFIAPMC